MRAGSELDHDRAARFLLVMSKVPRPFQAVPMTTRLDARQWLISAAMALSIILVAENRIACGGRPR